MFWWIRRKFLIHQHNQCQPRFVMNSPRCPWRHHLSCVSWYLTWPKKRLIHGQSSMASPISKPSYFHIFPAYFHSETMSHVFWFLKWWVDFICFGFYQGTVGAYTSSTMSAADCTAMNGVATPAVVEMQEVKTCIGKNGNCCVKYNEVPVTNKRVEIKETTLESWKVVKPLKWYTLRTWQKQNQQVHLQVYKYWLIF